MQTPDVLEFALSQRAALGAQIAALDAFIAALAGADEEPRPNPDTEPKPEPGGEEEPAPNPEEGEQPGGEQPEAPEAPDEPEQPSGPTPTPVPTPPVTGGYNAFGASELLAKLATLKGGETIIAKSGYAYEGLTIRGVNPAAKVTIAGEDAGARFGRLTIDASSKIALRDLSFMLIDIPMQTKATPYFVVANANTSEIEIEDSDFRSCTSADGYAAWDLPTWKAWRMGGALLSGPDSLVRDCLGIGLNAGFAVGGVRSVLANNRLFGASRDAYRLTADYCIADDNAIDDMIFLNDGNHPDMLQLFEAGNGQLTGLRIRRNKFRAQVNIKGSPLAATAQGIGGYGSPKAGGGSINTTFIDLVVEDNVVEATAWNGMNLTIVSDGLVQRNRISDPLGRTDGHARLRIVGACANTQVRDNSAPRLAISANAAQSGNVIA